MSSSVGDISNHHEQDDLSPDVNQVEEERVIVQFNPFGEAVRPNATHFKNLIGDLVRKFVPIRYISWLKIPQIYKDDIWRGLVAKFDIPADIRKQIENQCLNDKEVQMRAKSVESRKRRMYGHTGGRKSVAMVEYEMAEKRKGDVSRTEVWIETHKSKDRSIPPNVKPFMKKKNNSKSLETKIENMGTQLDLVYGHSKTQMLAVSSTAVLTHEVTSEPMPRVSCMSMPRVSRTPMSWMTHLPIPNLAPHSSAQETNSSSRLSYQKMMNNAPISPLVEGNSTTSAHNEPNVTLRWCELLDGNNRCVVIAREVIDPNHKNMCHNYFLK